MFWVGLQWARPRGPVWMKFAHGCFLMALVFPLESVRRYWNAQIGHVDLASNVALLSIEALLFVGLVLAMWGNPRVVRPARHVALLMTFMFPALLIDFLSSSLSSEPDSAFQPKPPAAAASSSRRCATLHLDHFRRDGPADRLQ